jgi:hypothetical protein
MGPFWDATRAPRVGDVIAESVVWDVEDEGHGEYSVDLTDGSVVLVDAGCQCGDHADAVVAPIVPTASTRTRRTG